MSITARAKLTGVEREQIPLLLQAMQRRGSRFLHRGDVAQCNLKTRPEDRWGHQISINLKTLQMTWDSDWPTDKALLRAFNAERIIAQAENLGLIYEEQISQEGNYCIEVEVPEGLELA